MLNVKYSIFSSLFKLKVHSIPQKFRFYFQLKAKSKEISSERSKENTKNRRRLRRNIPSQIRSTQSITKNPNRSRPSLNSLKSLKK